jgi:hypothetical protein
MKSTTKRLDRRHFLRTVGGVSSAAIAAVTTTISPDEAQAYDPGQDELASRYRETDHVKAFYRTNGYETLKK